MFLSRARGPYSAAPCPRNTVCGHARAASKTYRRDCAFFACDRLGALGHGRRAVSGHPRQHRVIDPVLCNRRIGLGIAGNAIDQLDVQINDPAMKIAKLGQNYIHGGRITPRRRAEIHSPTR